MSNLTNKVMAAVLALIVMTQGCVTENEVEGIDVACTGIAEERNPEYIYELSWINIIGAVVFSELLLIPPLYVILSAHSCPVSKRHIDRGAVAEVVE